MKVKSSQEIAQFLTSIAQAQGVSVAEVEFKQGKNPSLTIFIDKDGGVDLDTCERFHRAIDEPLDEIDPTFGLPYTLNVSSPGLDRPLKTARDFQKCMGGKVEIKLFAPMKGKKFFEAKLVSYDGNCIEVEEGKETLKLEIAKIAKICRAIDFDGLI